MLQEELLMVKIVFVHPFLTLHISHGVCCWRTSIHNYIYIYICIYLFVYLFI